MKTQQEIEEFAKAEYPISSNALMYSFNNQTLCRLEREAYIKGFKASQEMDEKQIELTDKHHALGQLLRLIKRKQNNGLLTLTDAEQKIIEGVNDLIIRYFRLPDILRIDKSTPPQIKSEE